MKYKCIIFDCDGVLVDSELISAQVLKEMSQEMGFIIDLNHAIEEFTGKSLTDIISYIQERILGEIPKNFEIDFRKRTFAKFQSDLKPIEGIGEVLNALSIPFCVASSGPRNKIVLNLTKVDLMHQFTENNIFSSYDINSWKPEPEIYLFAAKNMGFDPSECVVVEDSIYGVQAAISGGFDTFVHAKKSNKKIFENMDVTVFYRMDKLIPLLDKA